MYSVVEADIVVDMTAPTPPARARTTIDRSSDAFARAAEPFRRELTLHCYRMLGALHEAEDAVQETYLRAWRSFDRFDDRGSMRAWLYRIATNVCLNALDSRKRVRRILPDAGAPAAPIVELPAGAPPADVVWLEPYPDARLDGIADDAPTPEARYVFHEAVRLAFVAAIQLLPPRQRAAILLCDVLGWTAAETASLLDTSTTAVNGMLQRGRETLAKRYPDGAPPALPRPSTTQQQLLDRYLRAWEGHDLDAFVALLKEDATFTMPPWPQWYAGREHIRSFFAMAWKTCRSLRLVPTAANRQPAFAVYERSLTGDSWDAHSIHVLTLDDAAISAMTSFLDPALFASLGLDVTIRG